MNQKELQKIEEKFELVTADEVKKHICPNATDKEIAYFLQVAKLNRLNPFLREIYLVKYGSTPASVLTGYEVYLKRAERTGKYNGFKAWTTGTGSELTAHIEVYRKDWDKPLYHEVEYSEYVGRKGDGTITKFWKKMPKTMLKKVVISQAFRFAFPDEFAGMPLIKEEFESDLIEPEKINPKANVQMPEAMPAEILEPEPMSFNDMLSSFEQAKIASGEKIYYAVLEKNNLQHSEQIQHISDGEAILAEMREAYKKEYAKTGAKKVKK